MESILHSIVAPLRPLRTEVHHWASSAQGTGKSPMEISRNIWSPIKRFLTRISVDTEFRVPGPWCFKDEERWLPIKSTRYNTLAVLQSLLDDRRGSVQISLSVEFLCDKCSQLVWMLALRCGVWVEPPLRWLLCRRLEQVLQLQMLQHH